MKRILLIAAIIPILGVKAAEKKADSHLVQEMQTLTWQQQVDQIDNEIRRKTNQKNLYLAKAARAQDQGDRLQFIRENLVDAKRYWQVAEAYRKEAQLLDLEIQLLKQKRAQILQEHNVTQYP